MSGGRRAREKTLEDEISPLRVLSALVSVAMKKQELLAEMDGQQCVDVEEETRT